MTATAGNATTASPDSGREAVIFDYGGVLTTPMGHTIDAWIEREDIDPASFTAALQRWLSRAAAPGTPIHRLETGELDNAAFERQLASELRTRDGQPVEAETSGGTGLLDRIFAEVELDRSMIALVEELRGHGVPVALLSNSWGGKYPRDLLARLFDVVVISSEVGMRKPDREIYDLTLARLEVRPDRATFIDDAEPNVLGARAAGLHGVLHETAARTRLQLSRRLPFLS